ncbi:MAG: hypothetical protein IKU62_03210 [Ruminiclostridium sp.]|nr:hypothetical protein [Ruminiclostridium sp.]
MQIRGRALAFTWIGCFLGAGFVSGQEISQFFNHFGLPGLIGQVIAIGLLALLCGLVFRLSRETGKDQVHQVAVPVEHPVLRGLAGGVSVTYMYSIYIVMCAGAGTMLEQLTGSHGLRLVSGAVFCGAVTLVAIRGMGGAVRVFSKIMPVLVTLSLIVVTCALVTYGREGIRFLPADTRNPLVNQWALAAVTFVSYNFLSGLGTLSSLGNMVRSERDIYVGVILGGLVLLVVSLGIHCAMASLSVCMEAELPMLYLAGELSPLLEALYAIVIFLGMFGASMSVFVPVPQYVFRFPKFRGRTVLVPVVLSVLAFVLSQAGFSDLIGTLYPIYGFIGFAYIAGVVIHAWMIHRKKLTGGDYGTNQ